VHIGMLPESRSRYKQAQKSPSMLQVTSCRHPVPPPISALGPHFATSVYSARSSRPRVTASSQSAMAVS
jgi:hypothetical protein